MDRLIATFAALVLVFFMATLALFLILVETADAATVDATLTGPTSLAPGDPALFTLAYTPSVTSSIYTSTATQLRVNGTLLSSASYTFDAAKGQMTFLQSFLDPGKALLDVIFDVSYISDGALSGGTYACASGVSCTTFIAAHTIGKKVLVAEDSAAASLSIFIGKPSPQPSLLAVALAQNISPVPLGGSLPLLASALALVGMAAKYRRKGARTAS